MATAYPTTQSTQRQATISGVGCSPTCSGGILHEVPKYREVEIIGKGTFGVVVKAIDINASAKKGGEEVVAIKLLPRDFMRGYRTYAKTDIVHQGSLSHPRIVCIKEVFLTSTHVGIVQEFVSGGDLHRFLQSMPGNRVSEVQARWFFQQMMIGLDYCHQRGVANRDLKLENLLLDLFQTPLPLLKICDFGYSKHEMNSSAKTGVGTAVYMAPEVIIGEGYAYDGKVADLWSVGIILYVMVFGRYPFDICDARFMGEMIRGEYEFPIDIKVSNEVKSLLSSP